MTIELDQRQSRLTFEDPNVASCRCITNGKIKEVDDEMSESIDDEITENIVDLNYELYDVV